MGKEKNMKKYIQKLSIIALAFCTIVMTSCDMDSETKSSLDSSSIFAQYSLAENAVLGILQSFGETNSYRGRFIPYYGMNTDVEWINGGDATKIPDGDKYDLCAYNPTPTNTQMNNTTNAYAKFYEGIERANMAIKGLRQYGNIESNTDMASLLGEAITLRTILYFDLIKGWGDVPARWEPISTQTMYQGRTDRDSIYVHLLDDLKEAEDYVAWPNASSTTSTTERVSKAFVKALRARIALCAGGYSQRADGTIRLSNLSALSPANMYAIAKDECEDIIKQGCNKLGTFEENFRKLCQDNVTAGGESIYEIPFSDGRGRVLYTWGIQHNTKDQYTFQAKGGVNGPLPTLFYDYDVEDVRRDITCVPYDWSSTGTDTTITSNNITYKVKKTHQQLRSIYKWCFGKLRYEWMNRYVTSTNDDGINFQYMRLADVYLMAAEAENYLNGPTAAAPYMRPILERALPAAKVSMLLAKYTANKDAFQKGIVEQRAFEFAGEQLRKEDLIRWNMLSTSLAAEKDKLDQLRNLSGDYADLPANLYTKLASDEVTLVIYGLNHGDTDEEGAKLVANEGYEKAAWISPTKLEDKYINALYYNNPDKYQYWPIWQTFIDSSNGMLDNSWLGY